MTLVRTVTLNRKVLRRVLTTHYIVELRCNEDTEPHTDQAICACALWYAVPQPNVGAAVAAWANHVADMTLVRTVTLNRKVLRRVLTTHYIVELRCNEDTEPHTDQAICACALWYAAPQPNVGAAVAAWANHVAEVLGLYDKVQ